MTRRTVAALAMWLGALTSHGESFAVEPAGGPPEPAAESADDLPASAGEAPDASVEGASWLAQGSNAPALGAQAGAGGGSGAGFAVVALLLVLALGGGAVVLHQRRGRKAPLGQAEARLKVLSSTRVGAKASVVSAEIGGRVLLLGVTDHNVTHLGWLDAETAPALEESSDDKESAEDDTALPPDYPGSALRNGASSALASTLSLSRFQDVLRGVQARPRAAARPAPQPPGASEPPSAASTLAELTTDVVISKRPSPTTVASSRRKRQRRQEATTSSSEVIELAPAREQAAVEGQVAGLLAHKARRDAPSSERREE